MSKLPPHFSQHWMKPTFPLVLQWNLRKTGNFLFLGMEIIRNSTRLDRKVYRKPTDAGLLLHYYSHVDMKYKHSPLKTMLNRAFKVPSNWQFFHQECERLKEIFTRLHYPEPLIHNTIRFFVEMKVTGSKRPPKQAGEIPVRIPLPFKDQRSVNKLREQLSDLSPLYLFIYSFYLFIYMYFIIIILYTATM